MSLEDEVIFKSHLQGESHVRWLSHWREEGSKANAWGKPTKIEKEENISFESLRCSTRTGTSRVMLILKGLGKRWESKQITFPISSQLRPRRKKFFDMHQWECRDNPFPKKNQRGIWELFQREHLHGLDSTLGPWRWAVASYRLVFGLSTWRFSAGLNDVFYVHCPHLLLTQTH